MHTGRHDTDLTELRGRGERQPGFVDDTFAAPAFLVHTGASGTSRRAAVAEHDDSLRDVPRWLGREYDWRSSGDGTPSLMNEDSPVASLSQDRRSTAVDLAATFVRGSDHRRLSDTLGCHY